jgi:hypothetical protein
LAENQPALAGKRADHLQGRGLGGAVKRAPQCLAVDRQDALTGRTEPLDKAPEAFGKGARIQQSEDARERVMCISLNLI